MTLPQIWNALHEGEIPTPGEKSFSSPAEARAWRTEMRARIARKKAEVEAREHRAAVAEARKQRRGY